MTDIRSVALGAAFFCAGLACFGFAGWSDASTAHKPPKVTATPVFVGPPGWSHQGKSDGLGLYVRSGDTGYSQDIEVEAKDGIKSLDALLATEIAYLRSLPDVFGCAPTDTTVCANHPAKYVSYTYTSPSGLPVTAELVIAVFGTTAYSARYNKSISQ